MVPESGTLEERKRALMLIPWTKCIFCSCVFVSRTDHNDPVCVGCIPILVAMEKAALQHRPIFHELPKDPALASPQVMYYDMNGIKIVI